MNEKQYTITLSNGTVLDGLEMNGNNFISRSMLDRSVLENSLSPVTISDGSTEEQHECMALVHLTPCEGGCWFVLRDLSPEELWKIKIESNLAFLSMMANLDL